MKELLEYLLQGILGDTKSEKKFEIIESEDSGRISYTIKSDPEYMGIIIGKTAE